LPETTGEGEGEDEGLVVVPAEVVAADEPSWLKNTGSPEPQPASVSVDATKVNNIPLI
jgi:hypothetical protein